MSPCTMQVQGTREKPGAEFKMAIVSLILVVERRVKAHFFQRDVYYEMPRSKMMYNVHFRFRFFWLLLGNIEKRVFKVTVTLILVVEQKEVHICNQRGKIYKIQLENIVK